MARQRRSVDWFVSTDGSAAPRVKRPLPTSIRMRIFERDGYRCVKCATPVVKHRAQARLFAPEKLGHIDHIQPLSRGGQHCESNLQLLCETCNSSKGADYEG